MALFPRESLLEPKRALRGNTREAIKGFVIDEFVQHCELVFPCFDRGKKITNTVG
jgi:hypothetical protein